MNELIVPALKIRQPIGEFFVCAFKASDLIKISWVDVRRMSGEAGEIDRYLGIQRRISEGRVKQLRKYVKTTDATFPTSIIVAIPGCCARWDESSRSLRIFDYVDDDASRSVPFDRIAKVLDGQHRIRGLAKPDGDQFTFDLGDDVDFDLNVAVFVEADIAQQATIFSTVNLAQTKVNKSLVYDLFSLAEARSPQKSAHAIAVALDDEIGSPFYRSIKRLGVATEGRGDFTEYLTQASFVEALLRYMSSDPVADRDFFLKNLDGTLPAPSLKELDKIIFRGLFVKGDDVQIAKIIWTYFQAISLRWPNSWNSSMEGNVIRRTNGFRAFMAVLGDYYKAALRGRRIGDLVSTNDFIDILKMVDIHDGGFIVEDFPPGSSGESQLKKRLKLGLDNRYS